MINSFRVAAALLLALSTVPALSQPVAPGSRESGRAAQAPATGTTASGVAAPGTTAPGPTAAGTPAAGSQSSEAALPDPAAAPPAPAVLRAQPGPAKAAPFVNYGDVALAPGIAALPTGGWRLSDAAARGELDRAQSQTLVALSRALAQRSEGRVTVIAQVTGPASDLATARRDSLARARSLKARMVAAGLPETRIDLRPLGMLAEARASLDILPPATPLPPEDLRP